LKTLLVSDSTALGLMEVRPEPAWRVSMTVLRNKELLAPDYGAMHVAAFLKVNGFEPRVVNVMADLQAGAGAFAEPVADPAALSEAPVAGPEAPLASRRYLFETLERERPDVVLIGVSIYNLALYSRRLLGEIKEACPGVKLVTGGIYSTFNAEEILADGHADAVIRGEGEVATADLLQRLREGRDLDGLEGVSYRAGGRILHNRPRPQITDLDGLPHPYTVAEDFKVRRRFDILSQLIPEADWIAGAGFLTSRGCPEACTFCLDPAINGRRTRFHSPSYVRDVLDYCAEHFDGGAGSFFFGDATFTMNRKRLARILEFLPDLPYAYHVQTRADYLDARTITDLASAGVTNVALGAETFNEDILQRVVHKRLEPGRVVEAAHALKKAGIKPMLTFIAGLPGESRDSILRTVDILKENGLFDSTFFPLVVFKGTALFEEFKAGVAPDEMEALRVNPMSEEFLFARGEFESAGDLTGFADYANALLQSERPREA
jgi:radical SAM superfamily enzyme YgiQ (UPF0313 family)